jgi:purine-nucleoside phosphorylase
MYSGNISSLNKRKGGGPFLIQNLLPKAVKFLHSKLGSRPVPRVAVVLGSGLGELTERLPSFSAVSYARIPGFAPSTTPGHTGKIVFSSLGRRPWAFLQGRWHFYEGYSMEQITFPYRVLKRLGVETLILTSAVGGISPRLKVGDLMLVRDHINFMGVNPLRGPHFADNGLRFPDMSQAYPKDLRDLAKKEARKLKISLNEGIYCADSGPCYETPAEIRVFKSWGADVIGMSLVPEVVVAKQEGLKVLAIAWISNKAAGLSPHPISHENVMAAGKRVEAKLARLITKMAKNF